MTVTLLLVWVRLRTTAGMAMLSAMVAVAVLVMGPLALILYRSFN